MQRRALQQYTCPPSYTSCSSVFCSCNYNYTTQICVVTCRYWLLAIPIAAGLLLLLAICAGGLLCYRRRRRRQKEEQLEKELQLAAAHPQVYGCTGTHGLLVVVVCVHTSAHTVVLGEHKPPHSPGKTPTLTHQHTPIEQCHTSAMVSRPQAIL